MPTTFAASAVIDAPPRKLYDIIADYRSGHPRILPKPPFISLEVEEGGMGAGTVMTVWMRVLGRRASFRAVVSEPEPGRVLVETNDNGYVSTFTVDPLDAGTRARVTIATAIYRRGPAGLVERWLVPRIMRPVYVRELARLAEVAAE